MASIVVAGSLAQRPGYGGHAWVFLQYLLGFRRLGHDVLFVDRLEPEMLGDEGPPVDSSPQLAYLAGVMAWSGLGDHWALLTDGGSRVLGLGREELHRRLTGADMVLNVMGYLDDDDLLGRCGTTVFLDIDPGFGQMWQALELHHMFRGHDRYVTIGENIGHPDCTIPTCGIDWITTKQPVVLDQWPASPVPDGPVTSVASWRGPFGPIEYEGRTYGLRVHEFRRFFELPRTAEVPFELALDIHQAEGPDLAALDEHGWKLVEPATVADTPERYRRYLQASLAELMIAKNMYVQSRSGWFSDRSACYLAAGRPVLAQDTGLAGLLPTGEGVVTFDTPLEAAAAVAEVTADPARHGAAARAIAEEHFDSDIVLGRLLDLLGVG